MSMSKYVIIFNSKVYRVFNYDPAKKCSKGDAYLFSDESEYGLVAAFGGMVLPCYGKCTIKDYLDATAPGIYITERGSRFILPDVKGIYNVSRVKDIKDSDALDEIDIDDTGTEIPTHISGEAYLPKTKVADDFLNKVFKLFLCLKRVSLSMFVAKLGAERFNFKRAMETNSSLSPTKFSQYLEDFEGQAAIILTDRPDAKHPMGHKIILFTHEPFDLDGCIPYDEAKEILDQLNAEEADFDLSE